MSSYFAMANAVEKSTPLFRDKEIFAVSKDINVRELERKYKFSRNSLIISQLLIFLYGVLCFYSQITPLKSELVSSMMYIIGNPIAWICFSLIILSAQKWHEKQGATKYHLRSKKVLEDINGSSKEL